MYAITRKNYLASNIAKMVKVYGNEYKFHPPTWLLPQDWNGFQQQISKKKAKTFIVKPEAGC